MKEIKVVLFAGFGGSCKGIKDATGESPEIAINHDPVALAMHKANNPETEHFPEDVWKATPAKVLRGRKVGLLWASPDCKHFSRAKGGKPVEKKIRSLAWVVCKWAAEAKPRVIFLENVREFEGWGPLVPMWACSDCRWKGTEGQATLERKHPACPRCESRRLREVKKDGATVLMPDPKRKGLTFRRFVGRLRNLGYSRIEWKVLDAADFGAPTHRLRLFLVARRDDRPIRWPEPTHADPKEISSDLFTRSLTPYRTAADCIDWAIPCPSIFDRPKPLADNTERRIAFGMKRYVLENQRPFIVGRGGPAYAGEPRDAMRPLGTILQKNSSAIVVPSLIRYNGEKGDGAHVHDVKEPLNTIPTENRFGIMAATLVQTGYGEREGQSPRALDIEKPMGTMVDGCKQGLVAAFLARHWGGMVATGVDRPLPTTTTRATQDQIVAANLIRFNHDDAGVPIDKPMPTATCSNHAALVYSFLVKYFGTAIGQALDEPMHTATGKPRFGLVVVHVAGEPYVVVDIGMRMLKPRELARGQGFPDSWRLIGTQTKQIACIGNSVPPAVAAAVVKVNYP